MSAKPSRPKRRVPKEKKEVKFVPALGKENNDPDTDSDDDTMVAGPESTFPDHVDSWDAELVSNLPPALLTLQEFNMIDDMHGIDHPTVVCVGARRTGKSFWLRNFLYEHKERWPFGIVFTETRFNGFWQKHIPEEYIYDVYDPQLLQRVKERQEKLKEEQTRTGREDFNIDIFVVFDDVMGVSANTLLHDKVLESVLTLGRHVHMSVFFCIQDVFGLPPKVRNNMDLCVIFEQRQMRNMDEIYNNYLTKFIPRRVDGRNTITHYTKVKVSEEGEIEWKMAFVVVLSTNHPEMLAQLKWSIAKDPGPFLMGCPEWWKTQQTPVPLPRASQEERNMTAFAVRER